MRKFFYESLRYFIALAEATMPCTKTNLSFFNLLEEYGYTARLYVFLHGFIYVQAKKVLDTILNMNCGITGLSKVHFIVVCSPFTKDSSLVQCHCMRSDGVAQCTT